MAQVLVIKWIFCPHKQRHDVGTCRWGSNPGITFGGKTLGKRRIICQKDRCAALSFAGEIGRVFGKTVVHNFWLTISINDFAITKPTLKRFGLWRAQAKFAPSHLLLINFWGRNLVYLKRPIVLICNRLTNPRDRVHADLQIVCCLLIAPCKCASLLHQTTGSHRCITF